MYSYCHCIFIYCTPTVHMFYLIFNMQFFDPNDQRDGGEKLFSNIILWEFDILSHTQILKMINWIMYFLQLTYVRQLTDCSNTPSILLFNTRKFYLSKRVLMLNRLTKTLMLMYPVNQIYINCNTCPIGNELFSFASIQ